MEQHKTITAKERIELFLMDSDGEWVCHEKFMGNGEGVYHNHADCLPGVVPIVSERTTYVNTYEHLNEIQRKQLPLSRLAGVRLPLKIVWIEFRMQEVTIMTKEQLRKKTDKGLVSYTVWFLGITSFVLGYVITSSKK